MAPKKGMLLFDKVLSVLERVKLPIMLLSIMVASFVYWWLLAADGFYIGHEIVGHLYSSFLDSFGEIEANGWLYAYLYRTFWVVDDPGFSIDQSPRCLRLPNEILTLLTCGAVFLLGRAVAPESKRNVVGLASAFLFAVNGIVITASSYSRFYSLNMFCVTLTALALLKMCSTGRLVWSIPYALGLILSVSSMILSVFTVLPFTLFCLISTRCRKRLWLPALVAMALALAMLFFLWHCDPRANSRFNSYDDCILYRIANVVLTNGSFSFGIAESSLLPKSGFHFDIDDRDLDFTYKYLLEPNILSAVYNVGAKYAFVNAMLLVLLIVSVLGHRFRRGSFGRSGFCLGICLCCCALHLAVSWLYKGITNVSYFSYMVPFVCVMFGQLWSCKYVRFIMLVALSLWTPWCFANTKEYYTIGNTPAFLDYYDIRDKIIVPNEVQSYSYLIFISSDIYSGLKELASENDPNYGEELQSDMLNTRCLGGYDYEQRAALIDKLSGMRRREPLVVWMVVGQLDAEPATDRTIGLDLNDELGRAIWRNYRLHKLSYMFSYRCNRTFLYRLRFEPDAESN